MLLWNNRKEFEERDGDKTAREKKRVGRRMKAEREREREREMSQRGIIRFQRIDRLHNSF